MTVPTGTVLVTGAGGFVGSAVVRALVRAMRQSARHPTFADGLPVEHVVAVLRPGGTVDRLAELDPGPEWSMVRADLTQPDATTVLAASRPRAVLHLALDAACHRATSEVARRALVEPPIRTLLELLHTVPGAHLVSTGSVAVLQPGSGLDEKAPRAPNPAYLHYAHAKMLEEDLIEQLVGATGVRWTHLRLFYLFGRYEPPSRLLPYLVRSLARGVPAELSSGDQLRDYTDVDDVAGAYLLALAAPATLGNQRYHVGSGQGITIREFAMTVAARVGRPDLLHFGSGEAAEQEGREIVADVRRARLELGWSAPDQRSRLEQATTWWLEREQSGA